MSATPRGRQQGAKWTPTELPIRVGSSKQAIGGVSEVPVSAFSTPSTHPALQTGSRPACADDFWSDSSLAPSRSAVKNHRRTIAQLRPGATLTLGREFLRFQRSPTLRSCLGFAPQPLLIPPLQHRRGGRAAAARVRQQRCGSGSSRCRTSPRHHRKLLLLASALEQVCAHHAPAARSTLCPNPRCACTRAGSSSSPRIRKHRVLHADRMDTRGQGL